MTPDAEFAYTATPVRCHACAAIAKASRAFLDTDAAGQSDGLAFTVTRREPTA